MCKAVDRYIDELGILPDASMQKIHENCEAAGLPAITATPDEGKILTSMMRIAGARCVFETGTLDAVSTVWLAPRLAKNGCIHRRSSQSGRPGQKGLEGMAATERVED